MSLRNRPPAGLCPDEDCLRQFDGGMLPLEEIDRWESHLESCPVCIAKLEALERGRQIAHANDDGRPPFADLVDRPLRQSLEQFIALTAQLPSLREGTRDELSLGTFGDFEVLERIGAGGMGLVYRARRRETDRIVALKVMANSRVSPLAERRFLLEAEVTGKLQHPGIVRVHEVGEVEGRPYFVMDYLPGPSLADLTDEHPIATRPAAAIVELVAQAAQYAHERGFIHRDLKPSNVILDGDDHPVITDFGVAKRLGLDADAETRENLTVTDQILGTPAYMSPEQARGEPDVGVATDIYALGVMLYQLVVGRPPWPTRAWSAPARRSTNS